MATQRFKPRLVSVESRGCDITPGERLEKWADTRIRPSLSLINPNPQLPPRLPPKWGWPDWVAVALITICLMICVACIAAIWMIKTLPVQTGQMPCQYPDYCQIASFWED
jgi:hypothetical protein